MLERASHRDPAGANTGGASPEAIFEYFAAQILEATDERHLHTLLATSLFHDFTADDAVAISGHADAPEVLDDLCRRNLFTYRKSSVGQHYQYHALFREFLLREGLVEIDVPTRSSYVMAMVRPEERTLAAGVTSLVRVGGWAVAPAFAGALIGAGSLALPLVIAAGMKIAYDLALWAAFRRLPPPEEREA